MYEVGILNVYSYIVRGIGMFRWRGWWIDCCWCRPRLHLSLFPPRLPFSPLAFPPCPLCPLSLCWSELAAGPGGAALAAPAVPGAVGAAAGPGTVPWGAAEGRCHEDLEDSRRLTGASREELKAGSKSSERGPAAASLERARLRPQARAGRCSICCPCPGELLCTGGGDRARGFEDGAAGIPLLDVLFIETRTWM